MIVAQTDVVIAPYRTTIPSEAFVKKIVPMKAVIIQVESRLDEETSVVVLFQISPGIVLASLPSTRPSYCASSSSESLLTLPRDGWEKTPGLFDRPDFCVVWA